MTRAGRSLRVVLGVGIAVGGIALIAVAALLHLEGRAIATAASTPEPSALWSLVVDGGIEPLFAEPAPGTTLRPTDVARTISRVLLAIGAVGLVMLVGAALVLRGGRESDSA